MTKYLVVEDMRFMFDERTDIEVVGEFDNEEDADEYIRDHFCFVEWEGQFHRVYWIVKKES